MGFVGIVQVEDGRTHTGAGLLVNDDGTIDVNVKAFKAGTVAVTRKVVSTSSELLLDEDAYLGYAIKNMSSTGTVFVAWDTDPTLTSGYPIGPGEEFRLPAGVRSDLKVKILSENGGEDVRVVAFK